MGIFNEQSFDHPFAKGIQGAPGVGFSLTTDGNYDMNKKRLTELFRNGSVHEFYRMKALITLE